MTWQAPLICEGSTRAHLSAYIRAMQGPRIFAFLAAVSIGSLVAACGDDDAAAPVTGSAVVTCGAGTKLEGTVCVAGDAGTAPAPVTPGPSDAGTVTCGTGTVLQGTQCVLPAAALIKSARLTYLKVEYNASKPLLLDNSVDVRFGVTATSADNTKPVSTRVNVLFSFVEASPADPKNPQRCSSNGVLADLVGDNVERKFTAKLFPTSGDCKFVTGPTKVNLAVDFDKGLTDAKQPTGIDYPPVVFSPASQSAADNQRCRKSDGADKGLGCVYELTVQPAPKGADGKPLVDASLESVRPQSSVAVLDSPNQDPNVPAGKKESDVPALVVDTTIVLEGRDPYRHKVDPKTLPAEYVAAHPTILEDLKFADAGGVDSFDDLPAGAGGAAPATIKYDIVAKSKLAPDAWLPLQIDDPKNPSPEGLVDQIDITEIEPGTETHVTHALFLTGATRAAVTGSGAWANETDFIVRGCLKSNFEEAGNEGDDNQDEAPLGGDVAKADCKTFSVVLVKVQPQPSAASALAFNNTFTRTIGDPGLAALIGELNTTNTIDLSGARTETRAFVDLRGKIGSEFSVRLFNAYAKAGSTTQTATPTSFGTYIDLGVEVLGNNVFGYQNANTPNSSYTTDFRIAKNIEFPGLGYTFGPVTIGITAGVGGEAGLTPTLSVVANGSGDSSVPELAGATVSGFVDGTVEPRGILTGFVKGGIDVFVASATVAATVSIIDARAPVVGKLRWGVTQAAPDGKVAAMTAIGGVKWDLFITWFNLKVDAVGAIGPCPFCISETFNIYKFENSPETINLLDRQVGATVLN